MAVEIKPTVKPEDLTKDDYKFGWHDELKAAFKSERGLSEDGVRQISAMKDEPEWMLKFRLKALRHFNSRPMPNWGADLSEIDFSTTSSTTSSPRPSRARAGTTSPPTSRTPSTGWASPRRSRSSSVGVSAQYESEVVYHSIREDLEKQGVIFTDCDTGLREHPEIFRKYFGTIIPPNDNKFAALNSAVVGRIVRLRPRGGQGRDPLQAYFRINAENMGQFERTLIIAEPGSFVHYIEGCTAPTYTSDSLHSAVVELIAMEGARIRYTTIQNWSNNVYNLVTKRAIAQKNATVEWVDGNLGSKVTMKYPPST